MSSTTSSSAFPTNTSSLQHHESAWHEFGKWVLIGVLCGVALIALMLVCCCLVWRRHKKSKAAKRTRDQENGAFRRQEPKERYHPSTRNDRMATTNDHSSATYTATPAPRAKDEYAAPAYAPPRSHPAEEPEYRAQQADVHHGVTTNHDGHSGSYPERSSEYAPQKQYTTQPVSGAHGQETRQYTTQELSGRGVGGEGTRSGFAQQAEGYAAKDYARQAIGGGGGYTQKAEGYVAKEYDGQAMGGRQGASGYTHTAERVMGR